MIWNVLEAVDHLVELTGVDRGQARAFLERLDVIADGQVDSANLTFAISNAKMVPQPWQRGSNVYLMSKPGMLKIGRSETPEVRRAQVSRDLGEPVVLLAVRPHPLLHLAQAEELALHDRFAEHHITGEWFLDSPAIRAFFGI